MAVDVIDVTGAGSAGVFLIRGKKNLLFEAGMAYAAEAMVECIREKLGGEGIEAVLLSHSHYDHVAGLPALRRAYPGMRVYASEQAGEILERPSALGTIRRLSGKAADAAGIEWNGDYEDRDLRVDVTLRDGETVQIGDHSVHAFSTVGHTKCSLSYVVDGELMLCSETVGVINRRGHYMPSFLVDYKEAEASIERSRRYCAGQVLLNHYGLVGPDALPGIWDYLLKKLRDSRETMIRVMNAHGTDEERLRALEEEFHTGVDKKDQPDEAFDINAVSMMRTLRRQFPERFAGI